MTKRAIVEGVASLGYAVSVHRVNGVVEMHAVQLADPREQQLAAGAARGKAGADQAEQGQVRRPGNDPSRGS